MKITNVTSVGKASSVSKRRSKNSDGIFDSMLGVDDETSGESSVSALTAISSMDALIAAQTINTPFTQKESRFKHGNDILDYLDKLRVGMLSEEISPAIVSNIINEIRDKNVNNSEDKELEKIISEIELRAEVEIAKIMKQ